LDLAEILRICSPGKTSSDAIAKDLGDQRFYILAGCLDEKYSRLGMQHHSKSACLQYFEIADSGHAVLVEAPQKVSEILHSILKDEVAEGDSEVTIKIPIFNASGLSRKDETVSSSSKGINASLKDVKPFYMEYDRFSLELGTSEKRNGVSGIGWGDKSKGSLMKERYGFIISLSSYDNLYLGLGEVSPLDGVHRETMDEALSQIQLLKEGLMRLAPSDVPSLPCERILILDGSLELYIKNLCSKIFHFSDTNVIQLVTSVRAGLEMALLSIASQAEKKTIIEAILQKTSSWIDQDRIELPTLLPLNGLVTKDEVYTQS
jgi:hypothetical protein